MAIWSRMGLSGPAAGAGAAVIAVIVGGAYLFIQKDTSEALQGVPASTKVAVAPKVDVPTNLEVQTTPTPETPTPDTPTPTPEPEIPSEPVVEPEQTTTQAQVEVEPTSEPEVAAVPTPKAPAFDVVQVAPDGGGVIAGSAEPGQQVLFLLDGKEIARGKADASGKFGVLLDFPASDLPRALSIVTELKDGTQIASEGTVLISPVKIASADPEPEPEPKQEVDPTAEIATAPAEAEAAPVDPPEAPAVVLADSTGVKVLQPAAQPAVPSTQADAPVVANVVIDTITYDAEGEVALSGRGASQGFVRVYLNDQPIKTTRIAENGAWEAPLPDVDAGVYQLRVDEVDEDGVVTSRVETPFQREAPEIATATPQTATAVTVQPGFTLWAIARDRFGAGDQYVRVYEANRDLIRDPDLIYPGQVFALPEG